MKELPINNFVNAIDRINQQKYFEQEFIIRKNKNETAHLKKVLSVIYDHQIVLQLIQDAQLGLWSIGETTNDVNLVPEIKCLLKLWTRYMS